MALNTRRSFLVGGLSALITAPAIVRPTSLMRIKPVALPYMTPAEVYADLIHRLMMEAHTRANRAMDDCLNGSVFPHDSDERWPFLQQGLGMPKTHLHGDMFRTWSLAILAGTKTQGHTRGLTVANIWTCAGCGALSPDRDGVLPMYSRNL